MGYGHECVELALSTARGTRIANQRRMRLRPDLQAEGVKILREACANLGACRSQDNVYNCMGLVFASRRTQIDIDDVELLLAEDDYEKIESQVARPGDVVLYCIDDVPKHVGIISERHVGPEQGFTVLSQWGSYGEFYHPLDPHFDAYGAPSRFYTDRKGTP